MKSQIINWVGQSKSIIERNCRDASFTLVSDEQNEQKYEITSDSKGFYIQLVIFYKNGYCECQMIVGRANEDESLKLESIMRKHFCPNWEEIDSKHIQCGTILANQKKVYGNGPAVYALWWLDIDNK